MTSPILKVVPGYPREALNFVCEVYGLDPRYGLNETQEQWDKWNYLNQAIYSDRVITIFAIIPITGN